MTSSAALSDLLVRLDQLNEVGIALSGERNLEGLLERILLAAKTLTRADGGTLYLPTAEGTALQFAIVRNTSLDLAFGGSSAAPIPPGFAPLSLFTAQGEPATHLVVLHAAHTRQTIHVEDAYNTQDFDFSGTQRIDAANGYRSRSFLSVPMQNHEGELLGVLQLINATDAQSGEVTSFSAADHKLVESLASQAAIALTNRQLLAQFETLFESFIQLINIAIDEKSPHTGGHCERVPELTMMFAEALNRHNTGPLAEFTLSDKDLYELRIAALLHDCGKVTTPVHVVDKATKLQTLFDRIDLVEARFEVVRAEAEARCWQAIAQGADAGQQKAAFAEFCAQLEVDRAYIREANTGRERMPDALIAHMHRIAQTYEWRAPDGSRQPILTADELENLTIRAGTLTAAERQVINHHIVATIRMLEHLPWPKHLRRVPEFAGGHHERMDGKGYPRGLTRDQMSVPARMMGIADIFEALTAGDRPYKKAMPLSEALQILQKFRENGHIDPDLYDIFIDQKVYQRYAERFLEPGQIDV